MGRLSTTECTYLPTYLGYSSLSHTPWGPISIWFIGRVLITYHRPHTCLGLGFVLYAFE